MSTLSSLCDSIVMLTWSDWHTEPRSNRYHYAVRFAQHLPTFFVQPDLSRPEYEYEQTEIQNLSILHVYEASGTEQTALINRAILEKGHIKPLLWIYNSHFLDFVSTRYSGLKVYHATENYFSSDFGDPSSMQPHRDSLVRLLPHIDLLVAVSEWVLHAYLNDGGYRGEHIVLTNGCDFDFWKPRDDEAQRLTTANEKRIVFYQGTINNKIDYSLLIDIASAMTDWEFQLCGNDSKAPNKPWARLCSLKNVKYLGNLSPQQLREVAVRATVGIIPFVQTALMRGSFPLKAFEYVACGLPVVSIPIDSLSVFPRLFDFATNAEGFTSALKKVAASRHDPVMLRERREAAFVKSYDRNFKVLQETIVSCRRTGNTEILNLLVLYDDRSVHVNTLREHLESFARFSANRVFYAAATHQARCIHDLSLFDAIVIHYSVRVSLPDHLSQLFAQTLREFGGLKVLFVQDDYDTTEQARTWIERLGIHIVFTVVPQEFIEVVYPSSRFPYVRFVNTLTGYVPLDLREPEQLKPLSRRRLLIGYRGRNLPYWYGSLAREKLLIGQQMKKICMERGMPADIEWEYEHRIYGPSWYTFLEDCKATLGTESGSNVFDNHGQVRKSIEDALQVNPSLTYEEVFERFVVNCEGEPIMNQISPKMFEAIGHKTALVLFEGSYSGILCPNVHYIPLRKDFSNVDEVLARLNDETYLEELTNRAYIDIIQSGKFSYKSFIADFDSIVADFIRKGNGQYLVSGLVGRKGELSDDEPLHTQISACTSELLSHTRRLLPVVRAPKVETPREAFIRACKILSDRRACQAAASPQIARCCQVPSHDHPGSTKHTATQRGKSLLNWPPQPNSAGYKLVGLDRWIVRKLC